MNQQLINRFRRGGVECDQPFIFFSMAVYVSDRNLRFLDGDNSISDECTDIESTSTSPATRMISYLTGTIRTAKRRDVA